MTQGYIGISKINKRTGDLNEWNVMGIVYIKMHGCTCMMHVIVYQVMMIWLMMLR